MGRLAARFSVTSTVHGLENVTEAAGPCIFVANHPSALDEGLVRDALTRVTPRLVSVAVDPRPGVRGLVDRALSLRSASRLAALLASGTSVLLFAERTHTDDGSLGEFDLGAAALGIRTGAALVPVTLQGTFRAQPPWRTAAAPGRPRVAVVFGRPIRTSPGDEPSAVTTSIVKAISAGLAEESLGWYGALRSQADGGDGAGSPVGTEADWRRVWKATAVPSASARRTVWR